MTKPEALHAFMSGFGWTAYPNQATQGADGKDPAFPYLVYEQNIGSIEDGPIPIVINLWDYSGTPQTVLDKAQDISDKISLGGIFIPCDGGAIHIQRGTPFSQAQTDQASQYIQGRYLQITAEYFTEN